MSELLPENVLRDIDERMTAKVFELDTMSESSQESQPALNPENKTAMENLMWDIIDQRRRDGKFRISSDQQWISTQVPVESGVPGLELAEGYAESLLLEIQQRVITQKSANSPELTSSFRLTYLKKEEFSDSKPVITNVLTLVFRQNEPNVPLFGLTDEAKNLELLIPELNDDVATDILVDLGSCQNSIKPRPALPLAS